MNLTALQVAVLTSFVAVAAAVYYVGLGLSRARDLTRERLALYGRGSVLQDGERDKELHRPFADRALAPIVSALGRSAARFTPVGWIERTDRRITLAGLSLRMDANSWAVIKVFASVGGLLLWFVIQGGLTTQSRVLTFLMLAGAGFFGPDAYLNRKIDERREAMLRQLPDILDLLVISVEAGLGFDASLARVVQSVPGELSNEFHRMLAETRVGVSRREAMRALRERTDVDELRSFLMAMMQAESYGVPIARVLRVQAEEMRIKRRQRAQEKAFAAPVKMVFPLMLLIGSFMIILMGPAALTIFDSVLGK